MEADILVIGSGPAGIQAAIHAARRKARVLVAGKLEKSALAKAHVENMFGIPGKAHGMTILRTGKSQAESFGARFCGLDVIHIERKKDGFLARMEDGTEVSAKAVVFALGTKRKAPKLARADELLGKGVSYCADCDALFYRKKDVVVVGGESAAASSAVMLKGYAKTVHLVSERLEIPPGMVDELKKSGVSINEGRKVSEILGKDSVEGVKLDNGNIIRADGVFIETGSKGSIELGVSLDVVPDSDGFMHIDRKMAASVPGIFACGDITGPPLQASKAAGEGCIAGLGAAEYVKSAQPGGKAPEKDMSGSGDTWESTHQPSQAELEWILKNSRTVAVVGMSPKKNSMSFKVGMYLKNHGYSIYPVNPNHTEINGMKSYPGLLDIPVKIDVVDIFRKPEAVGEIVDDSIKIGAKAVWMQEGIVNEEAAKKAAGAGIRVVMDRCMYKEHKRMSGSDA
jgi:thioredoxin reductase (NADPH)